MKLVINIVESEIPEAALLPMPTEPIYSSAGLIKGNAALSKTAHAQTGPMWNSAFTRDESILTKTVETFLFNQLVFPFISKTMNAAMGPLPQDSIGIVTV